MTNFFLYEGQNPLMAVLLLFFTNVCLPPFPWKFVEEQRFVVVF